MNLSTLLLSILLILPLLACSSKPPVPVQTEYGRVIFLTYKNDKKEEWRHFVRLENGDSVMVTDKSRVATINACVKVSFYELEPPTIESDTNCTQTERPVSLVLITDDAERLDCENSIKLGMDHGVVLTGSLRGSGAGALAGAVAPLQNPVGWVLYPFIAPYTITAGAVLGAGYGAITSMPEEQIPPELIPDIRAMITRHGDAMRLQRDFRQTLVVASSKLPSPVFTDTGAICDDAPDTGISAEENTGTADLVLEARITNIGFMKTHRDRIHEDSLNIETLEPVEEDPEVRLFVVGQARILNEETDQVSVVHPLIYKSDSRRFSEWNTPDLNLFDRELKQANELFAAEILYYYFSN